MVTVAARILGFAAAAWFAVACRACACDLPATETGTVASVIDGETLKLTDGRTVRLIGAKAPMPPLGWRGEDPRPFVDEAKRLAALAANRPVELKPGGSRLDRYGHLLAQVFVVTGGTRLWLQEGTVATVGEGGGRIYLNFAKDWRSDFTISVDRKDVPAFAAAGIDLKALAGKRLRVRGFLGWRNGPMIEASHPEQIELLPEAPKQDIPPPRPTAPAIAL
jgi:endonuclease YncB( thermonuclease family)